MKLGNLVYYGPQDLRWSMKDSKVSKWLELYKPLTEPVTESQSWLRNSLEVLCYRATR